MSRIDVPLLRTGFGQTKRADNWWVEPLVVFLGCRGSISGSDHISHRFIRPNCSDPPTKVGLVRTQAGCPLGSQERC